MRNIRTHLIVYILIYEYTPVHAEKSLIRHTSIFIFASCILRFRAFANCEEIENGNGFGGLDEMNGVWQSKWLHRMASLSCHDIYLSLSSPLFCDRFFFWGVVVVVGSVSADDYLF